MNTRNTHTRAPTHTLKLHVHHQLQSHTRYTSINNNRPTRIKTNTRVKTNRLTRATRLAATERQRGEEAHAHHHLTHSLACNNRQTRGTHTHTSGAHRHLAHPLPLPPSSSSDVASTRRHADLCCKSRSSLFQLAYSPASTFNPHSGHTGEYTRVAQHKT